MSVHIHKSTEDFIRNSALAAAAGVPRRGLNSMVLCFDSEEAEQLLRKAHFNVLSFYLMGKPIYQNFALFNEQAVKLLKDPKIRGRRRQILEKFAGRCAALRFAHKLSDVDFDDLQLKGEKRCLVFPTRR